MLHRYKIIVWWNWLCFVCRELYFRTEVTFYDKQAYSDPGFTLQLSQKMNYDQVANAVAEYLGTDPYLLQFFKYQGWASVYMSLICNGIHYISKPL